MEKLYKAHPEKLRAIGKYIYVDVLVSNSVNVLVGVSNFSVEFLERLLANSEVIPAVNQIELHPYVLFDTLLALFSSEISGRALNKTSSISATARELLSPHTLPSDLTTPLSPPMPLSKRSLTSTRFSLQIF